MAKQTSGKRSVLFALIDETHYEALRYIAYKERRPIADVAREAIGRFIDQKSSEYPIKELISSGEERLIVPKQ